MNVRAISQSYDILLSRFPSLTAEGIGEFKDFQHSITLSDDAKPQASKLRSVPLSRRENVNKEVENMVNDGIWEKIDKSSWAHPMVSVPKPNGQICITTYALPNMHFFLNDHHFAVVRKLVRLYDS